MKTNVSLWIGLFYSLLLGLALSACSLSYNDDGVCVESPGNKCPAASPQKPTESSWLA